MNVKHSLLAVALGLTLGGTALAASLSAGEAQVLLERNGFHDISPLEYRDGMWVGTAINPDGDLADVRIDPVNRHVTWSSEKSRTVTTTTTTSEPVEVVRTEPVVVEEAIPVVRRPIVVAQRVLVPVGGRLNRNTIREVLAAAGYSNVRDIDYLPRDNVWVAKGRDPSGQDMLLHVDPFEGHIVRVDD